MLLQNIPSYKKIPDTEFLVDYFKNEVSDSKAVFLTHFHADHYYGLKKSFKKKIICTATTKNLLKKIIGVEEKFLFEMEMYKFYEIEGSKVFCIDANHCPGSACFIFFVNSKIYLHTGDFRYQKNIHIDFFDFLSDDVKKIFKLSYPKFFDNNKKKFDIEYDAVYLDNTYENKHVFKTQKEVIFDTLLFLKKEIEKKSILAEPKIKILFPTYLVGKERLALCVAHYFNYEIYINERKENIFKCYSDYSIKELNNFVINITESFCEKYGKYQKKKIFAHNCEKLCKRRFIAI